MICVCLQTLPSVTLYRVVPGTFAGCGLDWTQEKQNYLIMRLQTLIRTLKAYLGSTVSFVGCKQVAYLDHILPTYSKASERQPPCPLSMHWLFQQEGYSVGVYTVRLWCPPMVCNPAG